MTHSQTHGQTQPFIVKDVHICKCCESTHSFVVLSAWCVLSTLAQNSRHFLTSLSLFLCELTSVCYREGVARKTAYSRLAPCVTCCVSAGVDEWGGWCRKGEGAGGTLVPGPGPGAPNNLHTLTTPSCRDLRIVQPSKITFKCTFLFPNIRRK